jgi:hypothetical protein
MQWHVPNCPFKGISKISGFNILPNENIKMQKEFGSFFKFVV